MTVYGHGNEMINCYPRCRVRDDVHRAVDAVGEVVEVNRHFNGPSLQIVVEAHHMATHDGDRLVRVAANKPRTKRCCRLPQLHGNSVRSLLPDRFTTRPRSRMQLRCLARSRDHGVVGTSLTRLTKNCDIEVAQRRSCSTREMSGQSPDGVSLQRAGLAPAGSDRWAFNKRRCDLHRVTQDLADRACHGDILPPPMARSPHDGGLPLYLQVPQGAPPASPAAADRHRPTAVWVGGILGHLTPMTTNQRAHLPHRPVHTKT